MQRNDRARPAPEVNANGLPSDRYTFTRRELEELIARTVDQTIARLEMEDASSSTVQQRTTSMSLARSVRQGADVIAGLLTEFIRGADHVDEFGYDRVFSERVLPLFDLLYSRYWRVAASGVENVPAKGRALLVANHSGTLPYDAMMISLALRNGHPQPRLVRFLYLDLFASIPFLSLMMNRMGLVVAHPDNATDLLNHDELTGVFPEGVKGIGKLYSERYQLARFGRGGFVRVALKTGAPIIPVAVTGAEEIHPMLARSETLARLLGIPYFPITPTFPWLGPLGLIPFPSKWTIRFGEPIDLAGHFTRHDPDNESHVLHISDHIRDTLQTMIVDTLRNR